MSNTGQYSQLTANVTIQLQNPGSDRPDNFTLDIKSWDTGSVSSVFNRTYATGVTRTATSPVNGGSLTQSPYYEITGITPFDYELVTTASGDCSYSTTTNLVQAAVTVYNPDSAVISPQSALGNDRDILYNFSGPYSGQTTSYKQHVAEFLMPPFGETGYYVNYPISGFTIEHVFTKYQADDSTVYGQFANGPLQTPYFELDTLYSDAEHFRLVGSQISGLNETPGQCYTRYKVTWNLSGNFTYVDFYWFANNNL